MLTTQEESSPTEYFYLRLQVYWDLYSDDIEELLLKTSTLIIQGSPLLYLYGGVGIKDLHSDDAGELAIETYTLMMQESELNNYFLMTQDFVLDVYSDKAGDFTLETFMLMMQGTLY